MRSSPAAFDPAAFIDSTIRAGVFHGQSIDAIATYLGLDRSIVEDWVKSLTADNTLWEFRPLPHPASICPHCSNTGWVDDQNWSLEYPDLPQERVPGNGKIRCLGELCS